MDIGILTYYNVHNHGALLQAYGLQQVLKQQGCHVEFLRFSRNYDMLEEGTEKKYKFGLSSFKFYLKYLFQNGFGTFFYNYGKRKALKKFSKENFCIKVRYSDFSGNAVCIGSDEVFAIDVGINPFFYGHCLNTSAIFSYAGSFGSTSREDIEKAGCAELISRGFEKMSGIAVRDQNSYNIVKDLVSTDPVLVCDPVILYGYKTELAALPKKEQKYILLYSYDKNSNSPEEKEAIKKFARTMGCKIYSVGYYHKWCDKNINVSPIELLGFVRDAQFVVTDTFHGSVLSIITGTPFAALPRTNKNKLSFLLSEYGLDDRILSNYSELEQIQKQEIDQDTLGAILEERRAASFAYLTARLGEVHDLS